MSQTSWAIKATTFPSGLAGLVSLPEEELAKLAAIHRTKGLSEATARAVADELTPHDVSAAHLDAELHLDPDDLANPVQAAAQPAVPCCVSSSVARSGSHSPMA